MGVLRGDHAAPIWGRKGGGGKGEKPLWDNGPKASPPRAQPRCPGRASPGRGPQGSSGLNRAFMGPRRPPGGFTGRRPSTRAVDGALSRFLLIPFIICAAVNTRRRRRRWNAGLPGRPHGEGHRGGRGGRKPSAVPRQPPAGAPRSRSPGGASEESPRQTPPASPALPQPRDSGQRHQGRVRASDVAVRLARAARPGRLWVWVPLSFWG